MTFNVGDFMFSILRFMTSFTQKLYDLINYEFSLKWLNTALKLIGIDANIPNNISLLGLLGVLSVGTLIVLIVYNIFK